MENKFIEATSQRPQGDRALDASLVTIDLGLFIELIRKEKTFTDSDRNAITVFKTDGMRIVLIALHKDAELIKHTAEGIINIQVLEGLIQFRTDEQAVELSKDQMLALHKGIPHSILAKEESIFLLTLTTSLNKK